MKTASDCETRDCVRSTALHTTYALPPIEVLQRRYNCCLRIYAVYFPFVRFEK